VSSNEQIQIQSKPATSISGELEDVSVLNIMQFIHHGMRSGSLLLTRGDEQASVRFNCGRIVNASAPGSAQLGERLIDDALINSERLLESLSEQASEQVMRPLGSILLERQVVPKDDLQAALTQQVEETIRRLLQWDRGSFAFTLDDPLSEAPEPELRAQISLDTQAVLLECLQLIEGRSVDGEGDAQSAPAADLQVADQDARIFGERDAAEALDGLRGRGAVQGTSAATPERVPVRFQLLSGDHRLADELGGALAGQAAGHLVPVELRDAGAALPGEAPPILLVDFRHGFSLAQLNALRRRRPRAALVVISDAPLETASLYAAGATVVERSDPETLSACLASLATQRGRALLDVTESHLFSTSLRKLRRALVELRSGLLSSTVALNLLHFLADSVERAVLMLVRSGGLEVFGAFGFNQQSGRPLADVTRGMVLPRGQSNPLCSSIDDGQAYSVNFDDCGLPERFAAAVGRPVSGQSVVVPVPGRTGVVCIVYTDNGQVETMIENIEIFDVVTTQLGMAFENELLQRRLAKLEGQSQ